MSRGKYTTEEDYGLIHLGDNSNINPSPYQSNSNQSERNDESSKVEVLNQTINNLTARLTQMESELHQYRQQDSYIEEVKTILHQKEPSLEKLVEISLKQEKMKHDQKYFKILEILKNKDTVINALKSKVDQYNNSANSFHQEIQQFEIYKQHMIQEIEQKANLFKLNNEGKDISTLAEVKHEYDIISSQLNEKVEEINNYNIVITNLEEKNKALVTDLEQMQKKFLEKDTHVSSLQKQITDLEEKNADQKDQVNKLVEKVTSLAEDNMKNFSERSKNIEKGETYIHQVKELTDEIQNFKEINSKLEEEKNQINSVHMDFLLSCHNLINPGMEIGEDWDLEFVQNGILNNIKDMHDSIEYYKKRHEDDEQLLKHMEKEIHKVQQKLAGKKYSTQVAQTDMIGSDVLLLTSRIDQLEHEYQKVVKENEEMVRYIGDLENTVNKLSMENDSIGKQMLNDKKYMKSTTSLTYSIDDENDNNFEIQKNSIGTSGNSPTFRVDDKENISLNSSSQTISDVIDTSRVKNSNKKVIKLNKIKLKGNKSELLDPSLLKNKSAEQQILIVEQRRQIEELKKFNLNLEGKYNYEVKDKNHTISSLERKIEGLQVINNKLKLEKNNHEGTEDNLEHYIQQLEIDKVSLENELQDALKEKEYFEHDNDELSLQVQDLESLNLALRIKLETPDFNIEEETTVNILSLKVSEQKREIRQLKGNLEKTKNKYENLLLQLTPKHTDEYAFGGDLLQSSLSYSLGVSKELKNKDLIHIDSLVAKNPNNKNHEEKLLENSLLNSLQSVEEKTTGRNRLKKSHLKSSDLEVPAYKKSKAKDDTELLVHNMGEKESVVKWLHSQLIHHQKLVSHLASEIESLINQNNDMNREVIEMRQDYVEKLNTLHNQFSEEKEALIQEKREYESKFNIAKLDIKLGYKEEKIKQLQKRLSELREEFDSESSNFKSQLKQYKSEISDCNKRFETQQDELDKCNGSLLEKQSQIEILTETIQTLQQQDYDSMSAKFLDQNAELCRYRGMNQKLEFEVQLYYQKIHNKEEENIS